MKKKIILGITNTKDCGVTLILNGKIEASVNEERFNRKKGYQGKNPNNRRSVNASQSKHSD